MVNVFQVFKTIKLDIKDDMHGYIHTHTNVTGFEITHLPRTIINI